MIDRPHLLLLRRVPSRIAYLNASPIPHVPWTVDGESFAYVVESCAAHSENWARDQAEDLFSFCNRSRSWSYDYYAARCCGDGEGICADYHSPTAVPTPPPSSVTPTGHPTASPSLAPSRNDMAAVAVAFDMVTAAFPGETERNVLRDAMAVYLQVETSSIKHLAINFTVGKTTERQRRTSRVVLRNMWRTFLSFLFFIHSFWFLLLIPHSIPFSPVFTTRRSWTSASCSFWKVLHESFRGRPATTNGLSTFRW